MWGRGGGEDGCGNGEVCGGRKGGGEDGYLFVNTKIQHSKFYRGSGRNLNFARDQYLSYTQTLNFARNHYNYIWCSNRKSFMIKKIF